MTSGLTEFVDKTIDIKRDGDRIEFREHGSEKEQTTIIVGQTIRWRNTDAKPHQLVSDIAVGGKPLLDTGVIGPGDDKDVLVDIDLYSSAGGQPANVITLKYHCLDEPDSHGELQILSAARRGSSPV